MALTAYMVQMNNPSGSSGKLVPHNVLVGAGAPANVLFN